MSVHGRGVGYPGHWRGHMVEATFSPPSDLPLSPPLSLDMGPGCPTLLLLTSGGEHWRLVQTCSLGPTPSPQLVLVPSGSHRNKYGWQVDGTHPSGMLSCFVKFPFYLGGKRICTYTMLYLRVIVAALHLEPASA